LNRFAFDPDRAETGTAGEEGNIDGLVHAVQVPLRLSPGRNDLPAEIEADVRQVLSGLTSVARGIGALRTHGGDAHGRGAALNRTEAGCARI
jgi:hypothetical protein